MHMSNQAGLNRCIGDKVHSALLRTYTCQVQKVLWSLMGWGLTNKSAWATTVDFCTEMFTYTHFLFPWAPVPYYSCWLITKPRLGNGSCPSSQCLPHLGDLTDRLGIWQHVYMIHKRRCCLGRLESDTERQKDMRKWSKHIRCWQKK